MPGSKGASPLLTGTVLPFVSSAWGAIVVVEIVKWINFIERSSYNGIGIAKELEIKTDLWRISNFKTLNYGRHLSIGNNVCVAPHSLPTMSVVSSGLLRPSIASASRVQSCLHVHVAK